MATVQIPRRYRHCEPTAGGVALSFPRQTKSLQNKGWYGILCKTYYAVPDMRLVVSWDVSAMKFERELLKGAAPLAVLQVLSRGRMYGYELSEALAKRSGDILTLGRGTLYPLLYNLEAKGLIRSAVQLSENGRQRRYYSITTKGKKQLANHRRQWEKLQEGMSRVFGTFDGEAAAQCP